MKKLLLFALLLPTLAGAQIVKPGKPGTGGGGGSTPVVNNLNQSTTGSALDAVQGATLKNMVAAKLNISDTTSFIRKITGWRLISPTEINKLANTSGVNSGDQTISISGSRITLSGGGGFVDVPSTGGSTPIANNLTTTATGSALDATQGKRLSDSVAVHRADINANKILANSKQAAITTSSALAAGSLTLANRPALGDSSSSVPTTGSMKAEIERALSKLKVNRDSIRALFSVTGTGLSYDPTTGKFTFTGGGGSSGPWSTSGTTAYYNNPVGIGTNAPYSLFTVAGNAQAAEFHITGTNNAQTDSYKIGKLTDFGPQIAGRWAFNSSGTMYDQGNAEIKADGTLSLRGSQIIVNDRPLTFRPNTVAAIVTAWNAATSNATVHIQSGSYDFTGITLLISGKTNVTLKADKDVTLFNTNGGTIILSNGNNTGVTIDGLILTTTFVQSSSTNDLSTSLLYTNEQGTNTGVEVKNCRFSAPNCRMNLVTTSAYSSRKSGGNGQGKLQSNLSYHDNEFGPGGRMGIELTSHTNEDSLFTTIYMRNVSIKNNYFHDLGLLPRNGDGVFNGMGPSVSGPIEMVEIANNHLVDCKLLGIETAGAKRVNITDNVIDYVNQAFTGISVSDNTTRFDARDINIVGNQIRSKTKGINMYRVAEVNAANNQVKIDQDTGDGGNVYIQECLGITLTGGSVQGRANNTIRIDNSNQVQIGGGIRLKNDRVTFPLVSIFGSSSAPSTWINVNDDVFFVKSNGPATSGVVETIGTTSNVTGVR